MAFPVDGPNGVGLSPEEDWVYVAETHTGRVRRWRIGEPGVLDSPYGRSTRGELVVGLPGEQLLDSLAVDGDGHVCVATIRNGGITDIDPAERRDRARAHRRPPDHQHLLRRPRPAHGLHHLLPQRHAGQADLAPPRPAA